MLNALRERHRRVAADDAGFSLVEVVVAMVIFAITVSAVLGMVLGIFDVARGNTHRVAAANLATKQIESTRSMRTLDIPDGATTRTEQVAGTTFTITQTANYVVAGSSSNVCEGSGDELAYKLVTVQVTWPNMGSVQPVRSDTLKALGLGDDGLDSSRGSLAVAVTGGTGGPVAGVAVTIAPGGVTRVTGADGCAVFVGLAPGSYTVSTGQTGFVSHVNTRTASLTQGVLAGRVTRAELLYDGSRSLAVTWAPPSGHRPATGIPLRYRSTYVSDGSIVRTCGTVPAGNACALTMPGTVQNLYPAIYDLNGGSCTDARGGSANVDLLAGDASVAVPLAGFRVRVQNSAGNLVPGIPVVAEHAADSDARGCVSGESYPVGTAAGGEDLIALPYGRWTFRAASAGSQTVTVAPGDGVRTVVLVIGGGDDDDDDDDKDKKDKTKKDDD